ncbi:MAG: hypothetical protein JXC32_21955 [Anaerolineae bacterium]|nr:hypothetical protein [Anaerolineae bacterium]
MRRDDAIRLRHMLDANATAADCYVRDGDPGWCWAESATSLVLNPVGALVGDEVLYGHA